MAKVTSKLQVTIPKPLAEKYGIEPGDDIRWSASGDAIRLSPGPGAPKRSVEQRLELFDRATARQRKREKNQEKTSAEGTVERTWSREELYDRGRSD